MLAIAPFDVFSPDLQLWKEELADVLARNIDAGSTAAAFRADYEHSG